MKKVNSRDKGQRGERDLAKTLTDAGFPSTRGATQSAGANTADVVGLPGHWLEAKFYKQHAAMRFLDQAKRDVNEKGSGEIPVALLKENYGDWAVLLDLRVYLALLRLLIAKGVDIHRLNLGDFIEKPSRLPQVKTTKRVVGVKLSTVKPKKAS